MHRSITAMAVLLLSTSALAGTSEQFAACTGIADDGERLACYDRAMGRSSPQPPVSFDTTLPVEMETPVPAETASPAPAAMTPPPSPFSTAVRPPGVTPIGDAWELDPQANRGTFVFRPYRPNYFLYRVTNRENDQPFRPLLDLAPEDDLGLDDHELKFQLSFKTKVWDDILGSGSNLWFAYTQQSHWQVFNGDASRPFRETNYEPEIMWVNPLDIEFGQFKLRYATLGYTHQSNGRADPLSRSWDRLFAEVGGEIGSNFAFWVRPWWRIPEDDEDDDNPDIEEYIGRGEIVGVYQNGGHTYSARLRNNFSLGDNRGSVLAAWSFPIMGQLRGYVQFFSGYGESMIDYNWSQTTIGAGVMLTDWL